MKNESFDGDTINDDLGSDQSDQAEKRERRAGSGRMSICQLCDSGNTLDGNITHVRE